MSNPKLASTSPLKSDDSSRSDRRPFAIRQKPLHLYWMRGEAHRFISLKTIVLSRRRVILNREEGALRSCLPSDFDVECANYFMLGKRPEVWFNRGTQRDGKCSVPPLKTL